MGGAVATTVLEGDRQFNLTVRLAPEISRQHRAIGATSRSATRRQRRNAYIPLRELATISSIPGASYIYHERTSATFPIKFSVRGRDLGSTVAEAQERIAKNVKLPTGYRIDLGRRVRGSAARQAAARDRRADQPRC
jgi:heavy metal efflux system protein